MGQQFYEGLNHRILSRPRLAILLAFVNRLITIAGYISYTVLIIYCMIHHQKWLHLVLIPGAAFVLLTWFRDRISAPRPYELYNITAVNKKDTRGKSFPSRHVFSCYLVGMSYFAAGLYVAGAVILCMSIFLSVLRVLLGVHFIRDVIAGAVCGLASGVILLIISAVVG